MCQKKEYRKTFKNRHDVPKTKTQKNAKYTDTMGAQKYSKNIEKMKKTDKLFQKTENIDEWLKKKNENNVPKNKTTEKCKQLQTRWTSKENKEHRKIEKGHVVPIKQKCKKQP